MKSIVLAISLASLSLVTLSGCKKITVTQLSKDTPPVTLTLAKATATVGDTIDVSFDRALTPPVGQQYWLTLAPAGSPDSVWGDWHYVARSASSDKLTAKTGGDFEVRLHDTHPAHTSGVIGRSRITVGSPVAATATPITLKLAKTEGKVGQPFEITFNQPLVAPPGQQYWITLAPVSSPDSEWGIWHYVAAGATTDKLVPTKAGSFEIRLQDLYPRRSSGVLQRQIVTVR